MDITSLSMTLAQNSLMTNVGTAMLSKSMDAVEIAGAQLTNMIDAVSMEHAVNPHIGSNIDVFV